MQENPDGHPTEHGREQEKPLENGTPNWTIGALIKGSPVGQSRALPDTKGKVAADRRKNMSVLRVARTRDRLTTNV